MTDLRRVYTDIPPHYERVNRIITLGMDRRWRRVMVRKAVKAAPGRWLDMCTGTGETALLLTDHAPGNTIVFAADYSIHMLEEFKKKHTAIPVTLADAYTMPFADNSFELVTTSFATRNLHINRDHLDRAFREFHRILAPGGRYVSIESSRPAMGIVDAVFRGFVKTMVEPVGRRISGTRAGYAYLSRSIRSFYSPDVLGDILQHAGFTSVAWKRLFLGAAAVHIAVK